MRLGTRGSGGWLSVWRGAGPFSNITEVVPRACLGCGRVGTYVEDVGVLRQEVADHPARYHG